MFVCMYCIHSNICQYVCMCIWLCNSAGVYILILIFFCSIYFQITYEVIISLWNHNISAFSFPFWICFTNQCWSLTSFYRIFCYLSILTTECKKSFNFNLNKCNQKSTKRLCNSYSRWDRLSNTLYHYNMN